MSGLASFFWTYPFGLPTASLQQKSTELFLENRVELEPTPMKKQETTNEKIHFLKVVFFCFFSSKKITACSHLPRTKPKKSRHHSRRTGCAENGSTAHPEGPLETGMTGPTAVPPWVFSRIPKFEDAAQHAGKKSEDSSEPGQKPYIEKGGFKIENTTEKPIYLPLPQDV